MKGKQKSLTPFSCYQHLHERIHRIRDKISNTDRFMVKPIVFWFERQMCLNCVFDSISSHQFKPSLILAPN